VIYKKVCMLGAPGVGKTSLTQRFVNGVFDERYLVTIGAKIDARTVVTSSGEVQLMVWDLNGEEMFERVQTSYLRGMHGYLLVFDPTRPDTLEFALRLQATVQQRAPKVPGVLVRGKADLRPQWQVPDDATQPLERTGLIVVNASAKTGEGTEDAFTSLASRMLETSVTAS
jgi:small GTP-binding protein